ncbi:MAG TPA: hypothetical protein ENH85_11590 [Candidatus Scalindua sp.]|nr:hypothetical protein [Candidatus Scalindua sp.]
MPCYNRQIHSEVAEDIFQLILETKERNDELAINMPSSPFISLNRNIIMEQGLDSDWILMWDNDIQVPTAKFIYRMIETASKYEAVITGLVVRLKLDSNEYACGMKAKDGSGYIRFTKAPLKPMEVDVIGAGITLIHCKWIRDNLDQPYYSFKDGKGVNGPTILPEDWRFCEKVKEKGGKIIVEPRISTIHWGMKGFTYEAK